MEIWFCDDNLARRQEIAEKFSCYNVKPFSSDIEKLIEHKRPNLILTHTKNSEILEKANRIGVPAIAFIDDETSIEELRAAGTYADLIEIDKLEKKLGEMLPKEYDITCPVVSQRNTQPMQYNSYQNEPVYNNQLTNQSLLTRNEIIVVASGKGGVGKTTFTACIALALNNKGAQVCAVDFDLISPTLGAILQVNTQKGIGNFLQGPEAMGNSYINNIMSVHPSGLNLLLPNGNNNIFLTRRDVEKILRNLVRQYEIIVIDVGTNTGEYVKACVDFATKLFLVTELTAPSVQMCKLWMQQICPRDMTKIHLLVNKQKKIGFPVTSAQRIINVNLVGSLPEDIKVVKGEGNGNPLPARGPFNKEIMAITDFVWPWRQAKIIKSGGLFSSLRGLIKN